jgi:hypothetical protein
VPVTGVRGVIEAHGTWPHRRDAVTRDADIGRVLAALQERFSARLVAVLLYGSYLRGARDTVLDFHVVVDSYSQTLGSGVSALSAWLLPPNVYYLTVGSGEGKVRAKYAVVSLAQLERHVTGIHPYFWARFAQPCNVLLTRDDHSRTRLIHVCERAIDTFLRRVAPTVTGDFTARDFWVRGFALTYRAELRAESGARPGVLFDDHSGYYEAILERLADDGKLLHTRGRYRVIDDGPGFAMIGWALVMVVGKGLSVLRLAKAVVTFDDPVDYVLWKIERHSGIKVEATSRERRYPLIFAWPLVWRLYRRGAFR